MKITPTPLTVEQRLREIFERHSITHNKERADHVREFLAAKVRKDRDEKKHSKSTWGQSTEGNHDVQQGASREDT
jgi:hypothetical protein